MYRAKTRGNHRLITTAVTIVLLAALMWSSAYAKEVILNDKGSVNLFPGGDFENDRQKSAMGGGAGRIVSDSVHSGRGALMLDASDMKKGELGFGTITADVEPNTSYFLQSYVRKFNTRKFKITIVWMDGNNKLVKYDNDWKGLDSPYGFSFHGGVFKSPADARKVKLIIGVINGGKCIFDDVGFYRLGAQLKIRSFGSSQAVCEAGKIESISCVVTNSGERDVTGINAFVDLPDGMKTSKAEETQYLSRLERGKTHVFRWPVKADAEGNYRIGLHLKSDNVRTAEEETLLFVNGKTPDLSPEPAKAAKAYVKDNSLILENQKFRMVFIKNKKGYGPFKIYAYSGENWYLTGGGKSLSEFATQTGRGEYERDVFPSDLKIIKGSGSEAVLELKGTEKDFDNVKWNFKFVFTLKTNDDKVKASYYCDADRDRKLIFLKGPFVYAGDGSFGSSKKMAIVPGVHYLLDREESSGEAEWDVNSLAPNQLKVCQGAMSVVSKAAPAGGGGKQAECFIGLAWNPLSLWDGENRKVQSVFSSPNRVTWQDNHLMGLYLPTVPRWVNENAVSASSPYPLTRGKTLEMEAWICASTLKGKYDYKPYTFWVDIYRMPTLPEQPMSFEENVNLAIDCYTNVIWFPNEMGWSANTGWKPSPRNEIIYRLWQAVHTSNSGKWKARGQEILDEVMPISDRPHFSFDAALRIGVPEPVLQRRFEKTRIHLKTQQADGSWRFTPRPGDVRPIGRKGDTSLGTCAQPVMELLEYYKVTGEKKSLNAALKGLRFMKKSFVRPEGAETWEVPIHEPNLIAASYAILACIDAYEITGDKTWLNEAKYWAYTGLPFIYFWNDTDRKCMKYTTISVIGSSMNANKRAHATKKWFPSSWRGRSVQWCGLVHAYSLQKLAKYDKSFDWLKTARGITIGGMQFQIETEKMGSAKYRGMYSDVWDLLRDRVVPVAINPDLILKNVYTFMGKDPDFYSIILTRHAGNVHVSSGNPVHNGKLDDNSVSFSLKQVYKAPSYVIVSGMSNPKKVFVNGKMLPKLEYREQGGLYNSEEGWSKKPGSSIIVIKVKSEANTGVKISGK